jgi:hypothetical protein
MAIVALEGAGAGRLIEVNRAFGRMLGIDAAELVRRQPGDLDASG